MAIYFYNKEPIDLAVISVMGVSVKPGDSPIGYFGTGLKFAIATLLRTDHRLHIIRNGEIIHFRTEREIIRGETFERVVMGNEKLGFTTRLGRDWEVWQAYRELYSNCLDEGGQISDRSPSGEWGTIIVVFGRGIEEAHAKRDRIFIQSKPLATSHNVDIHDYIGEPIGFFRGVRAHTICPPPIFTYNVRDGVRLTEDRTVKDGYGYATLCAKALVTIDDEAIITDAILAPNDTFEGKLDYNWTIDPSAAFMAVAERHRSNARLNQTARRLWERHAEFSKELEEAVLDDADIALFEQASVLFRRVGCEIEFRDIIFVNDLGRNVFGAVQRGRIYIDRKALDMGCRFLASTIYEEWLHLYNNYKDESRELQNLLFEKLFAMTDRLVQAENAKRERCGASLTKEASDA